MGNKISGATTDTSCVHHSALKMYSNFGTCRSQVCVCLHVISDNLSECLGPSVRRVDLWCRCCSGARDNDLQPGAAGFDRHCRGQRYSSSPSLPSRFCCSLVFLLILCFTFQFFPYMCRMFYPLITVSFIQCFCLEKAADI